MKRLLVIFFLVLLAAAAVAGEHQHAALVSSPGFDKMKTLVGEWKTTVPNMGDVIATYTLHSDGSALLEELRMPSMHGEQTMISVYYPAGKNVVMTHYCSGHNQPHMKASGASAESLKFAAMSVENLASKTADHMGGVTFTFQDNDHFTAAWKHEANGKSATMPLEFTRVR